MVSRIFDRKRSIRTLLLVGAAWALYATPALAFVFGEPLPQSPPIPTLGEPPPIFGQDPPGFTNEPPPLNGDPGDSQPPGVLASAPEPATLLAGLVGIGCAGAFGVWKRKHK